jgi:transcriptional regulator with XRE-family HTH domain
LDCGNEGELKLLLIGERVKKIRKELGLSQQKFGEKLKVSKSHISNIELGGDCPSDRLIRLLCIEYGINEEWLKYGTGEKNVYTVADQKEGIQNDDNYAKQIYNNHQKYLRIIALLTSGAAMTGKISLAEEPDLMNMISYLQYCFSHADDEKEKLRVVVKFENAFSDYLDFIKKLNGNYAQAQKAVVAQIKEIAADNKFSGGAHKPIEVGEKAETEIK